jgi:monofunctional biosynthetic peptidoglycan transglycosylase
VALSQLLDGSENPRGGSTLTQQLAKNLFLDGEKNLRRKLRELVYALELERVLTKEEILEIYLNVVEFGPEIYGIRQAAEEYFVKPPAGLTLIEAAYLASVLPAPTYHYQARQDRKRLPMWKVKSILKNMKDGQDITQQQLTIAQNQPLMVIVAPTESTLE